MNTQPPLVSFGLIGDPQYADRPPMAGRCYRNALALLAGTVERLNRETRRRTRVVGTFPDGNSALMLVCARLRHVAGTQWGNKKYMNMKHLEAALEDVSIAG